MISSREPCFLIPDTKVRQFLGFANFFKRFFTKFFTNLYNSLIFSLLNLKQNLVRQLIKFLNSDSRRHNAVLDYLKQWDTWHNTYKLKAKIKIVLTNCKHYPIFCFQLSVPGNGRLTSRLT